MGWWDGVSLCALVNLLRLWQREKSKDKSTYEGTRVDRAQWWTDGDRETVPRRVYVNFRFCLSLLTCPTSLKLHRAPLNKSQPKSTSAVPPLHDSETSQGRRRTRGSTNSHFYCRSDLRKTLVSFTPRSRLMRHGLPFCLKWFPMLTSALQREIKYATGSTHRTTAAWAQSARNCDAKPFYKYVLKCICLASQYLKLYEHFID